VVQRLQILTRRYPGSTSAGSLLYGVEFIVVPARESAAAHGNSSALKE
jgi:hypothetical protein